MLVNNAHTLSTMVAFYSGMIIVTETGDEMTAMMTASTMTDIG